jgi:hypothetical protein
MSVVMSVGNGNCRSTEALQSVLSRAVDVSFQGVTFSGLRDRCRGVDAIFERAWKAQEVQGNRAGKSNRSHLHSDTATIT